MHLAGMLYPIGKATTCGVCGKRFESGAARSRHIDREHRISADEDAQPFN